MKTTMMNASRYRSLRWPEYQAREYAETRARMAGLDDNAASAVADACMTLWDPDYTQREWDEFVDAEIAAHAAP